VKAKRRPAAGRSLKVSEAFRTFVLDQLEEMGGVIPRSMFGGVGLYCRGVFFGIIARDVLYLKVDDTNRSDFERRQSRPFRPFPGRSSSKQYFAVPVDVLESPLDLAEWARKAVAAAGSGRRKPESRTSKRVTRS
jgi:DNA transformation protein